MLRWPDLLDGGKIISLRRLVILAVSIVLIRLALLAIIEDKDIFLPINDALLTLAGGLATIGMMYAARHFEVRSRNAWLILAAQFKILLDAGIVVLAFPLIFWAFTITPIVASNKAVILLAITQSAIRERNQADKTFQESEDRYHSVVEQASDIIFLYDLETRRLLEGNLAFHRLLGYSIEDIAGLSIYDIVAHDKVSIDSNIEKIKKKKQYYVGRRKYRKKDGSLLDVEVYVNLISYEGKGILCSIARDITERKLAEEALHKSEQEKAAILDGLKNVSVEYLDPQMRIVWLNSAVQKHLNLSEDEIKGKRCFEIIQGLESPCPGCTALKALQTTRSQEGELITPDGKVWISHSNIIMNTNGDLAGVVHVAVNISDRKRAEKALAESENRYRAIFENTGTATMIIEDNTIVSLANSEMERLSGYSKEEIEGKISWTEFVVKEDLERMLEQHKLRRTDPNAALNNYEFRATNKNGDVKDILLRVDAIPGTKKSVASMLDITERKLAEKALQESENKYRAIFEITGTAMVIDEDNTIISLANSEFGRLTGYSREEIEGKKSWTEFVVKEDIERMLEQHKLRRTDPDAALRSYEFRIKDRNGNTRDILLNSDIIPGTKKSVASMLDITEQKRAAIALRENLHFLQHMMDTIPNPIFYKDGKGFYQGCNKAFENFLGLSKEEIVGKSVFDLYPRNLADKYSEMDQALFDHPGVQVYESPLLYADGTRRDVIFNKATYNDANGRLSGLVGVILDITERKLMDEALRSSHQILNGIINAIPVRVFWKDKDLVYLGCNTMFAQDAGFADPKDIKGKDDYQMGWRDQIELYRADDRQVIESGLPKLLIEEPQTTPEGNTITLLTSKIPLRNSEGKIIGVLGTYMDITERKRDEEMLRASLAEKELLLKEVHHRVKNNLQIISALLSLQSSYLNDEDIIKIFRDSQNRIKSMALVHENLYRSKDLGNVDFNEYMNQLVSHLSQSYGDLSHKINFKINSNNMYLNINTAIPCGMIINELISNSLKYAFPDGRSGEICIDLSSEDDSFKLIVSDNGVGIKGDLKIKDSKTLGFRLIDTLVKQIDGKMSLDTINGTRCEIHFKGLK